MGHAGNAAIYMTSWAFFVPYQIVECQSWRILHSEARVITLYHPSIVYYPWAFLLTRQWRSESCLNESAELQSKVDKINAGNCRTRFHGALNRLFSRIMLHFLNANSVWPQQQTSNSIFRYLAAPQCWWEKKGLLRTFCCSLLPRCDLYTYIYK